MEEKLREVAHKLSERICPHGPSFRPGWYQTVGIGKDQLFIYAVKLKEAQRAMAKILEPDNTFDGVPVLIKKMGRIAPLGGA